MNGLVFERALNVKGDSRSDFELSGDWHTLRTEAGIEDSSSGKGTVQFQVWGNNSLIWDSGPISAPAIAKPRIDIRGISDISLRTIASDAEIAASWAETMIEGFAGDTVDISGPSSHHEIK
jgi:alpha-glucosidase